MTNPNTRPAPTMVYGGAPSSDEATAPNPFADLRAGLDAAKRLREHLPGDAPELKQADETIAALEAAIDAADSAPTAPSKPGLEAAEYRDELSELAALINVRPDRGASEIIKLACLNIADLRNQLKAALWENPPRVVASTTADGLRDELATLRAENERLKAIWEAGHTEAMETRIALNQEVAQCDELRADNAARGEMIEQLREEMTEAYESCDKMAAQRNGYMVERDQARAELDTMIARVVAAESSLSGNAAELSNVRSERDAAREELTAAKMSADLQRAANHRLRVDRDHNYDRWQQTLRALNAALGEP